MNVQRLTQIEAALWFWIAAVRRRPRAAIAAVLTAALAGAALAATFLGINADTSRMVSSKLDYRQAQFDYLNAFPGVEDQFIVIARAPTPDAADAYARALVERLRARTDVVRDVFAPVADPFFERNGLLYLSFDELDQTLARLSQASSLVRALGETPSLEQLYDTLADAVENVEQMGPGGVDPSVLDRAFSSIAATINARLSEATPPKPLSWRTLFDGEEAGALNQRVVSITPVIDRSGFRASRDLLAEIRSEAAAAKDEARFAGVEAHVTGNLALRAEELASVTRGIGLSFAASFILVGGLLWAALRSARLVAVSLLSLVVSICITGGFAAVAFGALNLVSVAFAVLIVGLGIDYAIHFALHVQEARGGGAHTRAALYKTTRDIGAALALCAPTSAIAFFSFAPTAFVGMMQLGVISGVGVIVAFIVALTLLPAVFSLAPASSPSPQRRPRQGEQKLGFEHARNVAAISAIVLGAAALFVLPAVRFSADPMALRDPNAPTVQAFNLLFDDEATNPYSLSILEADRARALALAETLEAWPEVRQVILIESFVPEDQLDKLDAIEFAGAGFGLSFDEAPAERDPALPPPAERLSAALEDSGRAAGLELKAAMEALAARDARVKADVEADLFAFWGDQYRQLAAQTLASEITVEDLPQAVRDRFVGVDGRYRLQIEPSEDLRDPAALARFVDVVRDVDPRAAGSARSVYQSGQVISGAMLQAGILALIAVTIVLWLIVRDLVLVSVILFCLGLAGVLTAAAGVLFNTPFNFANVIVVPLLIGVGADSGIHLGLRARRAAAAADVYATATPRAVFFSGVTTIASFGTLAFSDHQGVASMGALLAIAIGFTLVCTTLVQPWLLDKVGRG
ncbi:MAG: MMPL family transporter [Pseudomonadota bacterium]